MSNKKAITVRKIKKQLEKAAKKQTRKHTIKGGAPPNKRVNFANGYDGAKEELELKTMRNILITEKDAKDKETQFFRDRVAADKKEARRQMLIKYAKDKIDRQEKQKTKLQEKQQRIRNEEQRIQHEEQMKEAIASQREMDKKSMAHDAARELGYYSSQEQEELDKRARALGYQNDLSMIAQEGGPGGPAGRERKRERELKTEREQKTKEMFIEKLKLNKAANLRKQQEQVKEEELLNVMTYEMDENKERDDKEAEEIERANEEEKENKLNVQENKLIRAYSKLTKLKNTYDESLKLYRNKLTFAVDKESIKSSLDYLNAQQKLAQQEIENLKKAAEQVKPKELVADLEHRKKQEQLKIGQAEQQEMRKKIERQIEQMEGNAKQALEAETAEVEWAEARKARSLEAREALKAAVGRKVAANREAVADKAAAAAAAPGFPIRFASAIKRQFTRKTSSRASPTTPASEAEPPAAEADAARLLATPPAATPRPEAAAEAKAVVDAAEEGAAKAVVDAAAARAAMGEAWVAPLEGVSAAAEEGAAKAVVDAAAARAAAAEAETRKNLIQTTRLISAEDKSKGKTLQKLLDEAAEKAAAAKTRKTLIKQARLISEEDSSAGITLKEVIDKRAVIRGRQADADAEDQAAARQYDEDNAKAIAVARVAVVRAKAKAAKQAAAAEAERLAAERVAAERVAAERVAAEAKAKDEKEAADKVASDKAAAEKAAADKVAADKAAAEKAAIESAAAIIKFNAARATAGERGAKKEDTEAALEARKDAADKVAAEKAVTERVAAEKAAADKVAAAEKAAALKAAAGRAKEVVAKTAAKKMAVAEAKKVAANREALRQLNEAREAKKRLNLLSGRVAEEGASAEAPAPVPAPEPAAPKWYTRVPSAIKRQFTRKASSPSTAPPTETNLITSYTI